MIAVDFKTLLVVEVHVHTGSVGHTLGRKTTSVNKEREQAAGQNKYLSAGHLPHLSSPPAARLVPALGQCLPPATTPGASSPEQSLLPTTSLSQSLPSLWSCGVRAGVVGVGGEQTCSVGRQR